MAERQVTIRVKADGSNVVQTFRLMGAEGERALGQIRTAANSQKQSFETLGKSMDQVRTRGTALNGGMRGVALQLSQVGQQTIATGDFVKSLAIQLPDLALGFGTVGIAMGVVAGVVLPVVASALFDTEEKGGKLKDQLSELNAATKQYQAAVERLRSPMADMREEFGRNEGAARRLFKVQSDFARLDALTALSSTRQSLAARFGDISSVSADFARNAVEITREMNRLNSPRTNAQGVSMVSDSELRANITRANELREAFSQIAPAVSRISQELGISEDAAAEFLSTLVELRDAEDTEGRIAANQRLVELYGASVNANETLTSEQRETFNALLQSLEAMIRFYSTSQSAADTTGSVAGNVKQIADEMNRAASEAIRFVSNLGTRSLAGIQAEVAALEGGGSRIDGQVARREADIRASDEFKTALQGPEGVRQGALEGLQREIELTREAAQLDERRAAALKEINDTGKGGSSGGAGKSLKELNEVARQTESIIKQAQQAAVGYSEVVSLLDQALRSGKISQEDYNRAMDIAREKFDKVGEGAKEAREDFRDFARSALTDIGSIGDALDQLGGRLVSRGFDALFDGLFPSAGGGGGGGRGLLGLGGFLGFLDGGGSIKAGEFAVVGERRPEIVTGPANVIGGAQTARLMQGGGGGGRIEVVARVENGSIVQDVRRISGEIAVQVTQAGIEQFTRSGLPQAVDRINKDPRRRG